MSSFPCTDIKLVLLLSCGLFLVLCSSKSYTVVSKDSCYQIAQRNGLELSAFLKMNPGLNCNNLQIGQQVIITTTADNIPTTKLYTIVAGDSCWKIGSTNGVTLAQLTLLNVGLDCSNLGIGKILIISKGNAPVPTVPPTFSLSISLDQFRQAVQTCGFPAPAESVYKSIITRATPDGGIITNREFAMFLAEILHESGGLVYKREINCISDGCPNAYRSPGDDPKLFYYGRSYIHLTWSYNYRSASLALFGDDRLVRNPDLVAQSDDISLAVSLWFWKANVHDKVKGGQFGAATKAINGGLECSPCRLACPTRFAYYSKILPKFGVTESPDSSGC
jgi:chitinase